MFFFVGYGGLGLVLMIAFFILAFTIPAQSRAWLWILVGILVLDLLTGAFLFALVQGAFLVFYLSRRRQAGRPPGAPQPPPGGTQPSPPPPPPAGWYPDPTMRYPQRLWDGHVWTATVRNGLQESRDLIQDPQAADRYPLLRQT